MQVASRIVVGHPQWATVYAMASIQTAWGACGVVWKNHENESAEGFAERPMDALLCRIYLPGLSLAQWRACVLERYANCQEVLGGTGHFHPETVPEWFGELESYLQNYYAASLRGWTHPQFVDNLAFWRPRLEWAQITPFQQRVLEVVARYGFARVH